MRTPELIEGRLVRRYKRFLADVELDTGEQVTAHTGNPGRMTGLTQQGSRVYLTHHPDPRRKLKYSWEIVQVGRTLVGINTTWPNRLVEEGIQRGVVSELTGYPHLRREVPWGSRGSRVDLLLHDGEPDVPADQAQGRCWVEVKNATLLEGRAALFPDAPSERGRKHLMELIDARAAGDRAVLFFVVQRADAREVRPADAVDPDYGALLRRAVAAGVEALAYQALVRPSRRSIALARRLPVVV